MGDSIVVYGALKAETWISESVISPRYAALEFQDAGFYEKDRTLRRAIARWENVSFAGLTGLSGAPVYNVSRRGYCGTVIRGALVNASDATSFYLDSEHVIRFLDAIVSGNSAIAYDPRCLNAPRKRQRRSLQTRLLLSASLPDTFLSGRAPP